MIRQHESPTFSLIFPTYNAASFIAETWNALDKFLGRVSESWEVLFVCDGCTDETPRLLREQAFWGRPCIRIVENTRNRGKGHVVRQGLKEARGRWRLFTDVDLAYTFEDVLHVARVLQAGAHVAIGSRTHPESRREIAPDLAGYAYRRQVQSQVFSAVARRWLNLPQRDTQAGLKGLSAWAVKTIWPHLHCNGFGFDCELLAACQRLDIRVMELPVTMRCDRRTTTTSFKAMRRTARELWSIRRQWAA